jgi:hypothetical protein
MNHGMKRRGRELSRHEEIDGVIRRVTIFYEFSDPETLEFVGKIRIK